MFLVFVMTFSSCAGLISCVNFGSNGFYFDHKTVVTYHYAKYGDTVYYLYFAELYGENALPHDDAFYYDHALDMGSFAEKLLDDVIESA